MDEFNWSASPLGTPSTWSPTLQTIVSLILHSKTPKFLAWGPELTLLYNDEYLSILGDKHPASLGRPLPEVWGEIWPNLESYFEDVFAGKSLYFEDAPYVIRRNGQDEKTWFSFAYTPIYDSNGKVAGLYCSLHETTDKVVTDQRRKEYEREIQRSALRAEEEHQRLTALLQAAPVGISFADTTGKMLLSSEANTRLWGEHPFSESVGEYGAWKGWWADGSERHGQPIQPHEWGLARALRGEVVTNDVVEIEPFGAPGTRKTVLLRATPVHNATGEIINAVVAQIDVTDRVKATAALKESEAKFRTITDAMPQMVWSTNEKGYCDYCNQRWYDFTGVAFGSASGEAWNDWIHPDDQKRAWDRWRYSLDTGEAYEIEYRLRHHTGQYRWVLARALPIRAENGHITQWMGTCTDIDEKKQTEAALLDARLRLEAALTAADLGTWTWDLQNNKVYADHNVARLFGIPEGDANGAPAEVFLTRLHPKDIQRGRQLLQHSIDTGQPYRDSYRVRRQDGSYRHILARGKVEYDKDGKPIWLPGAVLDITQQKQAEEALVRSESKFRRLVEANVIGIVQYRVDGPLAEVNDAFLKMVGYTREEFERTGLSWRELTPPEWIEENEKALEQLRTTGRMENFVKEYFRKDGSRATVYMGAANFEGTSDEGIAYILDISGLKETERLLRESEAEFRTITNALPQIVWSGRADGHIDYCNQQWYDFSGHPAGSTYGDTWSNSVHPEDFQHVVDNWRHSVENGTLFELEYRLRHKSGDYRWVLGRGLPVRDEHGHILRWMGTCTDIQEQKLTQEALQQTDRQKDEFLAMLAHELRNPLAPIASAAELLTVSRADEARVRQIGEVVSRQARHMTSLIDDLLDVSRVTRGLIKLTREPVEVSNLMAETVEQVRPIMKANGHALELHLSSDNAWVNGDKKRLVQVLANLLGNAAKYTPEGGHIVLQTSVTESEVALSVYDNGIGMSKELLARAFNLFAQGERTPDRSQGGLGIGLALVKKLVELHGGTVEAQSEGLGKGSQFTLRLPRLHRADGIQAVDSFPAAVAHGSQLQVMIVDDNMDAAQILAMYVEAVGHEAVIENLPSRALSRASELLPQVCLLDIGLPEFSGYELAQRLRTIPGMANAVLVAVTGYGQPGDKERAMSAGFDYHFVKPIDTKAFLELLSQVENASQQI